MQNEHVSLWIATTPDTSYPSLSENIEVDAAVIGGGIAGITTAYLLSEQGLKVAVVEMNKICQGNTGYTTAKITSLHDLIYVHLIKTFGEEQARMYADANQAAIQKIEDQIKKLNIDCDFEKTDAYTFSGNEKDVQVIAEEVEAAIKLGLPATYEEKTTLPFPIKAAIRFSDQALFHPRKYVLKLAEEIVKNGGHIFENTRATDIEEGKTECVVATDKKTIGATYVVIASHFPFLDRNQYFTKMAPYRSYVVAPKVEQTEIDGMFIDPNQYSIRPQPIGKDLYLIIGGEDHKVGQEENTERRYKKLEKYAKEKLKIGHTDYSWSAQDNFVNDRVPYFGLDSKDSKLVYVITGLGGWGMTNGTAGAMIVCDFILSKENAWSEIFNPQRGIKSAVKVIKENLNVGKELIKGKLKK